MGGIKVLVLTRRDGEAVILRQTGDDGAPQEVRIVVRIDGPQVKLNVDAPPEVRVRRKELVQETVPRADQLS